MTAIRALGAALICALLASGALAAEATAFGLDEIEVASVNEKGAIQVEAGSHPFALRTGFAVEAEEVSAGKFVPLGEPKDVRIAFPPGFVGNATAVPRCTAAQFQAGEEGECPNASAVGVAHVVYNEEATHTEAPVYSLVPTQGFVAKLGFIIQKVAPVTVDVGINPEPPYNVVAYATNLTEVEFLLSSQVTIWGNPAASIHDPERGHCLVNGGSCPAGISPVPFLTLPSACEAPLGFRFEADSWQEPSPPGGAYPFQAEAFVEDESAQPLSPTGCAGLQFSPEFSAEPSTESADSASSLDVDTTVPDEGLTSVDGRAGSTIKKAVVTLPEGVTVNPSQAEGLGACSEAQLAAEHAGSEPGEGCPESAKIGSVEVETPLLEGSLLKGSLYLATPFHNPYGSLIAFYVVIRDRDLGISVKLPAKVEADPETGQLTTTLGEAPYPIPQLPISHFRFHFNKGPRSPLVTPAACGTYTTHAVFTPWAEPSAQFGTSSSFEITSGPGGSPCPSGPGPFSPAFQAGTTSNSAGAFSPLSMRFLRGDGEQEMTKLSAVLPPGLVGKIAGLGRCSEAALAAATAKTGSEEQASPSCPASSQIGRVLVGAGVGPELTYVPGSVYLAGPYRGAPLSVAVITPAIAGPFDLGNVVVREGLDLNPRSAEVEIEGGASDPLPHILSGIPLRLRDLRVFTDRPGFTLNPTSCEEEAFRATLFGSGADLLSAVDDVPVALATRFQAADCASLAYKPRIHLKLSGGTTRTAHPALRVTITPRAGDANLDRAVLVLPKTEFIDNAHINNPCTRPQYAAQQCPPGSILGTARAVSPLLDEPLEGRVYFRSNGGERTLPDIVVDLKGLFEIEAVGQVDSVGERIRTTFESLPDAPASKLVVALKGGKAGLLVNSANLCEKTRRATSRLTGQNGRRYNSRPVLKTSCKKSKKAKGRHR